MYPDKEINTFSYESNDNSSESSWFNELNKHIGAKGKTVFFNENNFRLDLLDLIRTQGEPLLVHQYMHSIAFIDLLIKVT